MEGFRLSLSAYRKKKIYKHISVVLPDGYVLTQLGNQPQRGIQLVIFIVGHVGHNHYHEATRAARVHTSHYPILWKG